MEAKEIAHKNMPEEFKIEVKNKGTFDPDFVIGGWIINSMKEYARIKCKEQREICSEYVWDKWDISENKNSEESVRNAPEPKI